MEYTIDGAMLAGLLNDYCLVEHRLPLSSVRDYVVTLKYSQQFTTNKRASYQYWSTRLINAAQNIFPVETLRLLRMQGLMNYLRQGHYIGQLVNQFIEKVLLHLQPAVSRGTGRTYLPLQE